MRKLLIIADDFTGGLDTGVQFAARGAATRVVTDPDYDFRCAEEDVTVLAVQTRHLRAEDAYRVVYDAVRRAKLAGVQYIYKKTDSALRGNIGSELSAALDASGADAISFVPAFPQMGRTTKQGVHYVAGVPVAQSVFGKDPFEPVRSAEVAGIIREQSSKPVVLHDLEGNLAPSAPGIHVYDAETDEDLFEIGKGLGEKGLRLCAGCAGFAAVLADILIPGGAAQAFARLEPSLFVICGSMNPVTLRQMQQAEENGFTRVHLNPAQKLDAAWLESEACRAQVELWMRQAQMGGRFILDVNDPEGARDTEAYAEAHGLTTQELRACICAQLAQLMKKLLDGGLDATLLCTGGDTLLALMSALGVSELTPVGEMSAGVVLTNFTYNKKTYSILSKSGGFGEPELFCELADWIGSGKQKEAQV